MLAEAEAATEESEQPEVAVHPVPTTAMAGVWDHVEPLLKRAVDRNHGEETVADVHERLAGRQYQMWLVLVGNRVAGIAITTVVVAPRKKICRVVYAAGDDFDSWVSHLDATVETWARQLDCDVVQVFGRDGLQKAMKAIGARRVATIYQKDLA